jgi:hypothetical protein
VWLGGIAIVALTSDGLPERVATHFGADGRADGWMPKTSHFQLMMAVVAGMPPFIAGAFGAVRLLPAELINLPNKDYWLAPERRAESLGWIARAGFWFASAEAAFLIAIHLLVVQANSQTPPQLSNGIWVMLAAMGTSVAILLVATMRRFRHRPA